VRKRGKLGNSGVDTLQLINSDHFECQIVPVRAQITAQQPNIVGRRCAASLSSRLITAACPSKLSSTSKHVQFLVGDATLGCSMRFNGVARSGCLRLEKKPTSLDPKIILAKAGKGRSIIKYRRNQIIFSQGRAE
jgi:hypothetical protein